EALNHAPIKQMQINIEGGQRASPTESCSQSSKYSKRHSTAIEKITGRIPAECTASSLESALEALQDLGCAKLQIFLSFSRFVQWPPTDNSPSDPG
ncbi:hypothetical protein K0M31_019180, partial [Melipona bicolor]